jgi:uncharacterized Zn-finger protein
MNISQSLNTSNNNVDAQNSASAARNPCDCPDHNATMAVGHAHDNKDPTPMQQPQPQASSSRAVVSSKQLRVMRADRPVSTTESVLIVRNENVPPAIAQLPSVHNTPVTYPVQTRSAYSPRSMYNPRLPKVKIPAAAHDYQTGPFSRSTSPAFDDSAPHEALLHLAQQAPLSQSSSSSTSPRSSTSTQIIMSADKKEFICQTCGKIFSRKCDLIRHWRTHDDARPFQCDHPDCGRLFKYWSDLVVHKRIHSGERPYQCNFSGCDKLFVDSSSLSRHRKLHSKDGLLYMCNEPNCGMRFSKRVYFFRHIKKDHSKMPSLMDICYAFTSE